MESTTNSLIQLLGELAGLDDVWTVALSIGDFDVDRLFALAEEHLGGWTGAEPRPRPVIVPPALDGTEVHLVDRPGSAQTQLQIGHAAVPSGQPIWHRSPSSVIRTGKWANGPVPT